MIRRPISPALAEIVVALPPAAAAVLSLDGRRQSFQVVATCRELSIDIVRDDTGPARISILEARRLRGLLADAIDAADRCADHRQMELSIAMEAVT